MRPLLIPLVFLLVGLAGCLDGPTDGTDGTGDDGSSMDPLAVHDASPYIGSHPAYGYPTYGFTDDSYAGWSDHWTPTAKRDLPETLEGFEYVARPADVGGGNGIAVFGHYAFVGTSGSDLDVVDISDPAAPSVVATLDVPVRDAETIAYPDGQVVLVTTDGGEVFISDITDPTAPSRITTLTVTGGAHNVAVLPGTPLYYNSPSGGDVTDIWDLSDPANPDLVQQWENGAGCHDIMWHIDAHAEKYRGYCAGLGETQIWDVTDPKDPAVITSIPLPAIGTDSVPISISHLAMVNHDATVLIVGDETGGGALPACDVYVNTPVTGTASGPSGNLWFYDITDETDPVYVSKMSVSAPSFSTCTSHFGRVIEDTDHLVMAFYGAGVALVDFTDPGNPVLVDQWRPIEVDMAGPGTVWDAWYYQGYVFTGDTARGMDVLTFGSGLV